VSGAFGGWASTHQGWLGQQHLEALMKLTGNVTMCVCVCVCVCVVLTDRLHALDLQSAVVCCQTGLPSAKQSFVRLAGCNHVAMLEDCTHAVTCIPALTGWLVD